MFGLSIIEWVVIVTIALLLFRNCRFPGGPGPPWPRLSYNPAWTEAEDELRRRHCAANPRLDSDWPPGTMMDSNVPETVDVVST